MSIWRFERLRAKSTFLHHKVYKTIMKILGLTNLQKNPTHFQTRSKECIISKLKQLDYNSL
jgi:hypothetical protein